MAFFISWYNYDYEEADSFNVRIYNASGDFIGNNVWTKEEILNIGHGGIWVDPQLLTEQVPDTISNDILLRRCYLNWAHSSIAQHLYLHPNWVFRRLHMEQVASIYYLRTQNWQQGLSTLLIMKRKSHRVYQAYMPAIFMCTVPQLLHSMMRKHMLEQRYLSMSMDGLRI